MGCAVAKPIDANRARLMGFAALDPSDKSPRLPCYS
jgi:hypothetical protein